ncbi:N-acetyl-gamma-glutamyl-phosphate reductase [Melioribacter sp. OK-6-Me]|uniref:N-acetyl-gamma-glutamyl-phosphate reductase n=1 Tax=unclassified Melioribacter TaxID=2627329 RepID=UPI003ED9431A
MINVSIAGAAGYSGAELIKLLLRHPEVKIDKLFGYSTAGKKIDEVHPSFRYLLSKEIVPFETMSLSDTDILFVALPSGEAQSIVSEAYKKNVKVIDIGGDFRLKDVNLYKKYYKHEHLNPELLDEAVYGLPEWNTSEIKKAKIIANPGCYPTSVLLPLIPLLKEKLIKPDFISINSYSGTSGAGKSVNLSMIFTEVNENVRAYKVGNHQHIPEIDFYLQKFGNVATAFTFVPHLMPITRGIYTTIHCKTNKSTDRLEVEKVYKKYYSDKPFVRLIDDGIPEIKNVAYTNFCDIGFSIAGNDLIIMSAIDNLIKGAAGQAIQNMNLIFNYDQTLGLL